MKSHEIRSKFLKFFEKNGHTIVSSSLVIPAEDPTLLFTNAGMNQFKDCFLGTEKRSYVRATTSQKCVRAGGKHNDLEQVGFTDRHLTFFEMLGNFSFGDYFKKEAIQFAWKFLTEELGLPKEKLYPTIFQDDDEAFAIWRDIIGFEPRLITRKGAAENFWQMGDTGPCGPCTEIFYDRGEEFGPYEEDIGGQNDRYMEVWNLVFMQFNRQEDGQLIPLKQTGVDTGMGLERISAVMQGKHSLFHTDAMDPFHDAIEEFSGINYQTATRDQQIAINVLSDHIRSACIIISDGGLPSNEGRGYVLRKIIRRATLFAKKLGDTSYYSRLVPFVGKSLGDIYPELIDSQVFIQKVVQSEVDRFADSLTGGQHIFEKYVHEQKAQSLNFISGEQAFKLYDTYGFPLELTMVLAKDAGMAIDAADFEKSMEKQREQSGKKKTAARGFVIPENVVTEFVGYDALESISKILWFEQGKDASWIVTQTTPFFTATGGQVNDAGYVTIKGASYPVMNLHKHFGSEGQLAVVMQLGKPEAGEFNIIVGDMAHAVVNFGVRADTANNHTGTHLLQSALIQVLGRQVKQAGSVVHPDYLRFDFTNFEAMTPEQIGQTEELVNRKIRENIPVVVLNTTLEEAKKKGVIAIFGEKYNPEKVRVIHISDYSNELCGGTHVDAIGKIGLLKIVSESSVATGIRRIHALTGTKAIEYFQECHTTVKNLTEQLKAKPEEICATITKLREQRQQGIAQLGQLKAKMMDVNIPAWCQQVQLCGKIPFLYLDLDDVDTDQMRDIATKIDAKNPGVYLILSRTGEAKERVSFTGFISAKYQSQVDIKWLADILKAHGLFGGGKAGLIQGGGVCQDKGALRVSVSAWLETI